MSPDYIEQVKTFFAKENLENASRQELTQVLISEPSEWANWKGNKRNFRKPGTK